MADILIYGAGRMGRAISWAMRELSHDVTIIDKSTEALNKVDDGITPIKYLSGILVPDLVISALPYNENYNLAKDCINNKVKYCDLGGNIDVSEKINLHAENHRSSAVLTDLGLAPGWINIFAEEVYRKGMSDLSSIPIDIHMTVGGLPIDRNINPLGYYCNWSSEGLMNEYSDGCWILQDGEEKLVAPLTGLEQEPEFETFYTSGGAGKTILLMKKRGVKNCSYKTIRYNGHCELLRFLKNKCELDNYTLEKNIFVKGCSQPIEDKVVMGLSVKFKLGQFNYARQIDCDEKFSAMQKATGFACASVADWLVNYESEDKFALDYSDVDYSSFDKTLKKLLGKNEWLFSSVG